MARGFKTLLPFEATTAATRTSDKFYADGAKGILLRVTTANGASTPSFTPRLRAYTPSADGLVSANAVWIAASAITTDTDTLYILYPGASGGNVAEVDGIPIPTVFDLVLTRNTGNADTFVSAQMLP